MKNFIIKNYLLLVFLFTYNFLNAQDTIKVGIDNNYPPYEFLDNNGNPTGFNVDLIKSILTDYGKPYVIVAKPWNETYTLFKNGEIDVLSILFSADRNANFNLSIPHNLVSYGAFYNENYPNEINSINYNDEIIVIKGDIMSEVLKQQVSESNITTVNNAEEALKIIKENPSKIALLPKLQGLFIINKHKYDNIKLAVNILYPQKYCFAVNKNNKELIYYLNEGLSITKKNSTYDKLYQKWFSSLEPERASFSRFIKDYFIIFLFICLVLFIIIIWNLTLKRAINKRNKELKEELFARERSEMAIIESEERFRTLTDNSPAAIFIFNIQKIFFINNAACELSNYTKEELFKMSFLDILNGEKNKLLIQNLFDKTKINKTDNSRFDVQLIDKKGAVSWINISAVKSYYKAEPVIILTAFDITDRHDYEMEIIESKRMYSALLDNLPGMVYQCNNDINWTMGFISDGCIKLTGYNPEDIINNTKLSFNDIIHPDDQKYVWETVQKKIHQNKPFTLEYRIITKSNEIKWVWEQGKLIHVNDKVLLEGYIVDITERVDIKNELSKERLQYETMLQSIGDGVISTDADGKITMLNKTAEKLTGWKQTDAIGRPLEEVFNIINEFTRESCINPISKVLETGLITGLANHTVLISKDGKEYIISDSAAPIKNENNVITGVILVFSDNTANKKAEDAIKQSEYSYRKLFDTANDAIFILKGNQFVNCNLKTLEIFGYPKEEILGKTPDFVSPEYQFDGINSKEKAEYFISQAYTGRPQNFEWNHQNKNGAIINCEISLNKLELQNEDYLQAIVRDITQRKEYQKALSESEEKYKTLVEKANDGIAIIQDNKYVYANTKLSEMTGYKIEEVTGRSFLDFIHPDYHELIISYYKARLSKTTDIPSIYEIIAVHKSGLNLHLELNSNFVNYNGKPAIMVIVRDIMERKLVEDNFRLFKATIENSSDAIGMATPEGKHTYQNAAFERLFGFIKDNEISNTYKYKEVKVEVFKTIMSGNHFSGEVEMISKEGNLLNILLRAYPIFDSKGEITGLVGIHTDITEKKQIEAALHKSDEKFHMLLDLAVDAFFQGDENGNIITVNDAAVKMTGYSKDELLILNFIDLFQEEELARSPLKYSTLEMDVILKNERMVLCKNGTLIPVEMNSRKMPDNTYQSFFRDITERKKFEKDLIDSEKKYKVIVDYTPDAIIVHKKGIVVFANDAAVKMVGAQSADQIINKNTLDFVHPDYKGVVIERIKKMYEINQPQNLMEEKFIKLNNEAFDVEVVAIPINYMGEQAIQTIIRDITERKEAQKALIESEEKYRLIVDYSPDAIIIHIMGKIVFANAAAIKLIGAEYPEQIINKNAIDFVHPDHKEVALQRIKKIFDTNQPQSFVEEKFVKLNKETVDVEVVGIPIIYMGKQAVQTIIREITERKEAQKALIESEEKYRLLFENITQGFALHEIILDDAGKPVDYSYISANPAFEQLTGLDIENISGKRVKELIPNIEPYWIEKYAEVALTGKFLHYENYSASLEKYYDAWAFSPRKGQFAVIFSDITERKQAEDALKALLSLSQMGEKKLQEITDFALQECVNLTKSEIAFLAFVNENETKFRLHSFSKDIMKNTDIKDLSLDFDLTENNLFSIAVRTKKPVLINNYDEYPQKKKLPNWHINIDRVLTVPIEENNKIVAIATVANKKGNYNEIDIHQLTLVIDRLWKTIQSKNYNESIRKLNVELLEKNKEMEQFVYVTSHDLRSPLVNIQGFTKELVESCRTIKDTIDKETLLSVIKQKVISIYKEDIDESLKYIELSVRKMDALLNGLLKLSRMGRIVVNIKTIDMNALLKDIVNSFEFLIAKKNIEVHIETLNRCKADEVLINQVFSNLIDNAIKYCDKEKGYIKISSTPNNDKIIYCIEDNGPGIPEKYHQKIFEIFQRLNSSVTGEGLGLSIVNKIIEKHNGKIWLESEIKKGTKFFIELSA